MGRCDGRSLQTRIKTEVSRYLTVVVVSGFCPILASPAAAIALAHYMVRRSPF